ncbi:hypothetical protein D3C85_1538330 [compost metagenome]
MTGETVTFRIPAARGDLSSVIYRVGEVIGQDFEEDDLLFEVRLNQSDYEKSGYLLKEYEVRS